ncbi:sigma-70 family RNA polymerase sigma factor [Kitasatospora cinereorecta]
MLPLTVTPTHELSPDLAAMAAFLAVLAEGGGLEREDLEQAVWLRAVERTAAAGVPRDRRAWLRGLAVREALAGRRWGRETPVAKVTQRHRGPEEELLRAERLKVLRRALAELPGRCRELLEALAASPDLSYRQLAERLELPRGSIGPLRSRCLGCLRPLVASLRGE